MWNWRVGCCDVFSLGLKAGRAIGLLDWGVLGGMATLAVAAKPIGGNWFLGCEVCGDRLCLFFDGTFSCFY
jgi:hypothetical protein